MKNDLKAISHELRFWAGFVKTERFLNGWVADTKTPELHPVVYNFIKAISNPATKVLDLGSGVVSILNGTIPKQNLLACDPLGELYEVIFDYKHYGINPPIALHGEEIKFAEQFDIVHMSNAIDHAEFPEEIFANMANACKSGGFVIIQGFENEGEHMNYEGMHQWDFEVKDETLMVNKKPLTHPSLEVLKAYRFEGHYQGRTWYVYVAQKV